MLKAIILICRLAGPCDEEHAVDVLKTPAESAIPTTCLMLGEAYLAQTAIDVPAGYAPRVTCPRRK